MPRMKSYDEKDFMRDPTGPVPGSADRMLTRLYVAKFDQYYDAIRHIYNTGTKTNNLNRLSGNEVLAT